MDDNDKKIEGFDLKPCPFCGHDGEVCRGRHAFPNTPWYYFPRCSNYECIAHVLEDGELSGCNVEHDTPEEAAELWNKRFNEE